MLPEPPAQTSPELVFVFLYDGGTAMLNLPSVVVTCCHDSDGGALAGQRDVVSFADAVERPTAALRFSDGEQDAAMTIDRIIARRVPKRTERQGLRRVSFSIG